MNKTHVVLSLSRVVWIRLSLPDKAKCQNSNVSNNEAVSYNEHKLREQKSHKQQKVTSDISK